ncbi:nuclear transport factor 2 family protein [Rudanella paleaurantiibacter]|uniref:Nuclear transport factor 2 family protein n=1 Tax=Rudanella paleaurantiibacter TaxID=2614655 RepID=A0A7J5TZ58_9BACT|nr:nuclear transport factor 2 family protein [Rudanella paleaurantiibacter]KAB7730422.1 nuclear transport factor 2 family protein [Rudanella paleaurantiibacter]
MQQFFLIILAATALFSCDRQKLTTDSTATQNERLVQEYYAYFNKHDWANMAELYTEVADFKDPSLGEGIVKQTRQQTIKKYSELGVMFPDVKDEVVQIYSSGEKHVIVEFISSGTAPDSTKFTLPICTIFTIENGKITKDFTYYDNFEDPKP